MRFRVGVSPANICGYGRRKFRGIVFLRQLLELCIILVLFTRTKSHQSKNRFLSDISIFCCHGRLELIKVSLVLGLRLRLELGLGSG